MRIYNDSFYEAVKACGLVPLTDRMGQKVPNMYTLPGLHAPVDLTDCEPNEIAILKSALKQLSEQADDTHQKGIEKDLID